MTAEAISRSWRWFLGGPAYNYKIDCRHLGTIMQAGLFAQRKGHGLEDTHYVHNSVLPQGRAQWLQAALDTKADIAITMDADTWVRDRRTMVGGELLIRIASAMIDVHGFVGAGENREASDLAIIGMLVPQRDGRVNAWRAEGERLNEEGTFEVMRGDPSVRAWDSVHAVGLALAVYNLAWWRPHRDRIGTSFAMIPTGDGLAFVGEDVWHSRWIRDRGGRIMAADGIGTVHGGW